MELFCIVVSAVVVGGWVLSALSGWGAKKSLQEGLKVQHQLLEAAREDAEAASEFYFSRSDSLELTVWSGDFLGMKMSTHDTPLDYMGPDYKEPPELWFEIMREAPGQWLQRPTVTTGQRATEGAQKALAEMRPGDKYYEAQLQHVEKLQRRDWEPVEEFVAANLEAGFAKWSASPFYRPPARGGA